MATSDAVNEPAGKGKLKLIILIVVALLLAIGLSVGATWYFMHSAQSTPEAVVDPNVKVAAIYEPMAPAFVLNYNANGRQRYMQVSMTLQARNQADLDALKVHMPVIRNNLLMLLGGQTVSSLTNREDKESLRKQALAEVQKIMKANTGEAGVEDLYFTSFVVQ